MSASRKPSISEHVLHARDLKNAARNEQQKAIFLSEVARIRARVSSSTLIPESEKLPRQSRKAMARAKQLRNG